MSCLDLRRGLGEGKALVQPPGVPDGERERRLSRSSADGSGEAVHAGGFAMGYNSQPQYHSPNSALQVVCSTYFC